MPRNALIGYFYWKFSSDEQEIIPLRTYLKKLDTGLDEVDHLNQEGKPSRHALSSQSDCICSGLEIVYKTILELRVMCRKTQLKDASEHMSCRWDICLTCQILDKFIIHVCIFEHLWHRGPDALARSRREIHRTQEIIHIFPPAVQYMPHLNCT